MLRNALIALLVLWCAFDALATVTAKPPLLISLGHKADWQTCVMTHSGPIERPDHYTTHPFGRKADNA